MEENNQVVTMGPTDKPIILITSSSIATDNVNPKNGDTSLIVPIILGVIGGSGTLMAVSYLVIKKRHKILRG